MRQASLGTVLRHLRRLADPEGARELSDAQLLERFVSRREESAFAALVQRHGRLVWSVCRQMLRHEQDAEDAFQATFLALARHAASIRRGQAVSSWLYHVAQRVALKAGMDRSKRRAHERQAPPRTGGEPDAHAAWRELQAVLDAELQRLPEKYRAPFVLCCLEGKSKPEAARLLGWKEGTVSGRLAQARNLLRQRLTRRGMMFSAALCATTLALEASAAPAGLVCRTVGTAVPWATDQTAAAGVVGARVAALVEGVSNAMFASKAKLATALLLAAAVVTAGLGLLTHQALAGRQGDNPAADKRAGADQGRETPPRPADAARENKDNAIAIQGRVLGPDGKPVPGAKVRFLNAEVESDKDGAYRVSLARLDGDSGSFTKASRYWYMVLATADGYGPDFRQIGTADKEGILDLHLIKDDVPIEGRILDLEGRPVAGATVRVARLSAAADENLDVFLKAWKFGPAEALGGSSGIALIPLGSNQGKQIARPQWRTWWGYWEWNPVKPVTTDKDGKFRLTGVGRERYVELAVSGPTIQLAKVKVVTRKGIDVKDLSEPDPEYLKQQAFIMPRLPFPTLYGPTFEQSVGPAKPLVGVVRDKATGKPLAGVRVIGRVGARDLNDITDIDTVTGEKGRYRLTGFAKAENYFVGVVTKERTTYLPAGRELNDTEGLKPLQADFDLVRGVTVRGRLIDKATGKPASGMVSYALLPANPQFLEVGRTGGPVGEAVMQRQVVKEDGSFEMIVFPGAGVISARADDNRYLSLFVTPEDQKKGVSTPGPGATGGVFIHGHAYRVIDPDEGSEPLKLDLELLTGQTLKGTVVGPDGKPLTGATGIVARAPQATLGPQPQVPALHFQKDSAEFTLENVDPRRPLLLIFQHPEKNLAARLEVRGDEKDPLTARLQPGGKLTGRVLDAAGQPLADAGISVLLGKQEGQFATVQTFIASARTDKEGRFTIEGLLPETELILLVGITERKGDGGGGGQVGGRGASSRTIHGVNDLILKAGEAKDLGEMKTQYKTKPAGDK
jgi:RNA polymerase sigma factor (sigma-70 family)